MRKRKIEANARRQVSSMLRHALEPYTKDDALKQYASKLEKALCQIWHHSQAEYIANARRLIYSLQVNGMNLIFNYEPETLAALSNEELGRGTPMQQKREQHWKKRKELSQLFDAEMDIDLGFNFDEHRIIFPKCKTPMETVSRQTRSADEGMTTFCSCPKCEYNFKIH